MCNYEARISVLRTRKFEAENYPYKHPWESPEEFYKVYVELFDLEVKKKEVLMNNEILEISQWLHEKGFEPDMWSGVGDLEMYSPPEGEPTIILNNKKDDELYRAPGTIEFKEPYFTLNRALELLDKIKHFYVHETAIGYMWFSGPKIAEEVVNSNYHLAALRLLKKVVEEGYLNG